MRRTFGPKREEVAGGWRRLRSEELHNLYASPNVRLMTSRRLRWAWHVVRMARMRKAYKILIGKSERKRPLRRSRRRGEENIRMDVRERGWIVVDWINLAQDRNQWRVLVNTVMNLRVL
jgi:hypothetical protein